MPTILIVDDQLINQQIFAKLAAAIEDGVSVRTFGDPAQALRWMADNTPELIITDYKMPGMNGATFIRQLRRQPSLADVPVIVVTVFEERGFRLKALDAGATDFLQSPIDHREFLTRARNLLKMRKQQLLLADRASTLERSLERAIRDSSERLAQVIDSVPAMISATDRDGRLLFMNAYQADLSGLDPISPADGKGVDANRENSQRNRSLDKIVIERGTPVYDLEEEIVDRNGAKRIFLTSKSPLKCPSGETIGVVTSAIDITQRKAAESHLDYIAHHDSVTDLPNRVLLSDRLRREVARSRRGDRKFALHLIDLDGFKDVNDVRGHTVGDKLLVRLAERLRAIEAEGHVVARLGGDEFAVLQLDVARADLAEELAGRMRAMISEPCEISGEQVGTTASIGIAVHPSDGADVEDLLRNADLAMYQAKKAGGDQYRFYAADMEVRARHAATLDSDLRDALQREEFELHYQPQLDLCSMEIIGVEALLRWRRPDGTLVSPNGFLPRAEENGLIVPINEWVLAEACRQAVAWRRSGLPALRMAVNLSPVQFQRQTLPLFVARVLAESGLDPRHLDLELTESIVLQETDAVAVQLENLRQLGVLISIDDFGTGFSSLSYVKRFPVDRLKVDQSFIRDLMSDPRDSAIVRAIVSIAHTLNLKVVAEGVESVDHLRFLQEEGCDEAQGYYFAKPMPADELERFITEGRIRSPKYPAASYG